MSDARRTRPRGAGRDVARAALWPALAVLAPLLAAPPASAQVASAPAPAVRLNQPGFGTRTGIGTGSAINSGALNNGTSIGPSLGVSAPLASGEAVPPLLKPEALFPNLFGIGPTLRDHGVAVLLDNRNEFDGIISGPRKGASNSGQYGLEVDVDWEKLAGITGFATHFLSVGRYGIPISRAFGDELNPSQEIYGSGGNVANHLVYLYGEETLANGRFDLAAGRNPLLDDFAASPLYCTFENNAFCGNPKASSDDTGFTSYPDAGWSIRARVRPVPLVYIQSGIYFDQSNIYNYAENFRSGYTFDASYIDGETFPTEIGFEPEIGPQHLPGHYKVGFWYDSQNHPSDLYDDQDVPYVLSGRAARQVKGETAVYVLVDQMLLRNGKGDTNGLIALGGFFQNSAEVSTRYRQAEFGLIDNGFWHARPLDGFALAFNYLEVSPNVARAEELLQDIGSLPSPAPGEIPSSVMDGSTPFNATGIQTHTFDLEANYTIHVARGVTFAPDFQYFIRPNAQANLPNAALLGFISHIQFF